MRIDTEQITRSVSKAQVTHCTGARIETNTCNLKLLDRLDKMIRNSPLACSYLLSELCKEVREQLQI